jgi:hypothetical protein
MKIATIIGARPQFIIHPFRESESHRSITEKSVQDILRKLSEVWENLK